MPSTERRYVSRIVVPTIVAGAIALVVYLTLYSGATDGMEMEITSADVTQTQAYSAESRAQEVSALQSALEELDQALNDADLEQLAAPEREAVGEATRNSRSSD